MADMIRCHKCEAMISAGYAVYVKEMPYHPSCVPDHTAEIGIRNVVSINYRVAALERKVRNLEQRVLDLENPI